MHIQTIVVIHEPDTEIRFKGCYNQYVEQLQFRKCRDFVFLIDKAYIYGDIECINFLCFFTTFSGLFS